MLYCIVDIETTGSYASGSGITEIAAYVHDGEKVVEHFTTLINPERHIPTYITALTGISTAMVASAPVFEEIAEQLYDLLQDKIFVAHNVNFDYSFIRHHLSKCGFTLQVKKLCTVRLSRKTFIGLPSYSLGRICRSLSIPLEDRHRADGDAKATVLLFEKILLAGGKQQISEMLKRASGDQYLPLQITKKMVEELPTSPGVYYFIDEKGKVIYVGKAKNIKKRVSGHFTGENTGMRRQQFLRLINNVTYKECANELHALILESTEIKRLWPKYNYSQKEPLQKYALYHYTDSAGYSRLVIDKKRKALPGLCVFNLHNDGVTLLRKMCEQFELHPKLCFLDKNIFVHEEIKELEAVDSYNEKVESALQALEENLPTFAVVEKVPDGKEWLCLLMVKGSFYGMGYISTKMKKAPVEELKTTLEPFADNNFIRNSIYKYAETYPKKRIDFY